MPVPKGVDKKKFDDCVDKVKDKQGKKVNAYAVCNASLKKSDEQPASEAAPSDTKQPDVTQQATQAEPAKAPEPQVKLKPGLFQGFSLGSTFKQGPQGNVMTNVKPNPMDYEKAYKESTKNVKMSEEQLKNLNKKS